jgi:hypothetical protein
MVSISKLNSLGFKKYSDGLYYDNLCDFMYDPSNQELFEYSEADGEVNFCVR